MPPVAAVRIRTGTPSSWSTRTGKRDGFQVVALVVMESALKDDHDWPASLPQMTWPAWPATLGTGKWGTRPYGMTLAASTRRGRARSSPSRERWRRAGPRRRKAEGRRALAGPRVNVGLARFERGGAAS